MIYGDNIRKVMRLLESENINPGNLLIGQAVEVAVTDAKGTEFLRPMVVGEFYPDGSVLLKDPATQRSVVFQFQWNRSSMSKDLIYTAKSDFGVAYRFAISKELMSNKSVTKLSEKKLIEARIPKGKGRINYDDDLVKVYKDGKVIYSGEEDYEPMNQENWKYNEAFKAYELPGGYVKILIE